MSGKDQPSSTISAKIIQSRLTAERPVLAADAGVVGSICSMPVSVDWVIS